MTDQSVIHSTFVIERKYTQAPEKVFAAFADPAKKRRWFTASEHHAVEEYAMDFRPGGVEKARYKFKEGTPFPGVELANHGIYQNIVPNERIVEASSMTLGDRCISASLVTIELLADGKGTNLICTFQGAFFEGADGPQMREAGWRTLLERLAGELTQ